MKNKKRNKKGLSTIQAFLFIFAAFFFIVFLGLALFGFNQVNNVLDANISVGQVNLQEINGQTFGKMNTAFINNADNIGITVLLGMSVLMIINAFVLAKKYPRVFMAVDIFIIIFAFIASVYMAQTYETFINSTTLLDVYINDMPQSSKFILNLPAIMGTLGALIMIFSYSGMNRREDEINVGEFG